MNRKVEFVVEIAEETRGVGISLLGAPFDDEGCQHIANAVMAVIVSVTEGIPLADAVLPPTYQETSVTH